MAQIITGVKRRHEAIGELVKALGLDGRMVTGMTIRLAMNEQPTVTVECLLSPDEVQKVAEVLPDLQPLIVEAPKK